jgi:hypothetical protein
VTPEQNNTRDRYLLEHYSNNWTGSWFQGWEDCLRANGINTEDPMETNGAPEWVIEMFRTGKPIACRVCDANGKGKDAYIMGYTVGAFPYRDTSGTHWEHAEPIPAWTPKEGEAVFALDGRDRIHVGKITTTHPLGWDEEYRYGVTCQDGEYSLWRFNNLKPFDASKIGKPWSEL